MTKHNQRVLVEIMDGNDRIRYSWPSYREDIKENAVDVWRFVNDCDTGDFEKMMPVEKPNFRDVYRAINDDIILKYKQ